MPTTEIAAAIESEGRPETRCRKLTVVVVVLLTIAMNIYTRLSISGVMRKIGQGLRFIWPDSDYDLPGDSAISYRRYQLGARPVVALFHRVCRPIATPDTRGAFLFGLRVKALDSTIEDMPDTPENVAVFGRHRSDRGDGAFPQVRGVYLVECGTHAITDAGFWPCHTSERVGGFRMLRSVGEGSYLAYLYPSEYKRRQQGERLLIRVIEYTITGPALPGYGERHRLATTLLDHKLAPAVDVALAYHERWEIEIVIDEVDTHQRLVGRPLRSLKPVGVIQELYALLIAHFAIRFLMHEAACQTGIDPDRLSFTHALQVIQDAIPEFQMVEPDQLDRLYNRLLRDIADKRLPERHPRSNPRVVKRKMSKFHLKRPEHRHWPQPTRSWKQAVMLI